MPGHAPYQAYQGPGTNLGSGLHGAPGPGQSQPAAGMVLQGGSPTLYSTPSGQVPVNAAPAAPTIAAYAYPTADQRPSGTWPGFPTQFSNLDPSGERAFNHTGNIPSGNPPLPMQQLPTTSSGDYNDDDEDDDDDKGEDDEEDDDDSYLQTP